MSTGTLYLDVDDEITSAAARIRGAEATKVGLVVPYGSRIATSRMNFRLLSREALVNNRVLSIVATDAATRALAASAGLPVFTSVAEWEASGESGSAAIGTPPADGSAAETQVVPIPPTPAPGRAATGSRSRKKAATAAPDHAPTLGLPGAAADAAAAAGAGAASGAAAVAGPAASASTDTRQFPRPGPAEHPAAAPVRQTPPPSSTPAGSSRLPVVKGFTRPRIGAPVAIIAVALVLALVVGGVGAYLFLPSADIVITPREEEIGPIALVVRADPDVSAPDADANVVPAELLEIPVDVSETFATKGKRIEETVAKGEVTFRNVDFTATNTIPAGSVVSTPQSVKFKTDRSVTVPKAKLVGLQVVPSFADVAITAVKLGPGSNVEPNTITVIPPGEDPVTLSVRNQRATTGGTHEEFAQITADEVTAAVESLKPKLADAFATEVAASAGAAANAKVFQETAVLGESTPTVDPATLVGKEQESFEVGLTAIGTVIAVDDSPVRQIAETRLLANVGSDHRLVEGSIDIEPGDPTVNGSEISFPVTARASRVRILDPAALLALVKGRSVADARARLAEFGDVELTTWPDWVSAIPSLDSRLTIEIVGQTDDDGGGAQSPPASGRPTVTPRSSATTRSSSAPEPSDSPASAAPAAPAASSAP